MYRAALIARLPRLVHPPVLDAPAAYWMRQAVAALDSEATLQLVATLQNWVPLPLRGPEFEVSELGVAQLHPRIGVSEEPGGHWHRHAVHSRVVGVPVAQVVPAWQL